MALSILVTGGTGTLGRFVVPLLRETGSDVRVLSRHRHDSEGAVEFVTGDLATGEGIEAAVPGTEIIMHLVGSSKGDEEKGRHLVQAASQAGTRHLVNISVVGADRIPVVSAVDRTIFGFQSARYGEAAYCDCSANTRRMPSATPSGSRCNRSCLPGVERLSAHADSHDGREAAITPRPSR